MDIISSHGIRKLFPNVEILQDFFIKGHLRSKINKICKIIHISVGQNMAVNKKSIKDHRLTRMYKILLRIL